MVQLVLISCAPILAATATVSVMRVLIVEDNIRFCSLVAGHLSCEGFVVDHAHTIEDFQAIAASSRFDVFLVDLNLPDGNGIHLIRKLRRNGVATPIVIMTAEGDIDARIAGLEAGADDYLSKPFNNRELVARMRALLRRAPELLPPTVEVGSLAMDNMSGEIFWNGKRVELRPSEQRLLALMLRRVGRVVPRDVIESALQSLDKERSPNALDKLVSRLRRALTDRSTGLSVRTVRGAGYILEPES